MEVGIGKVIVHQKNFFEPASIFFFNKGEYLSLPAYNPAEACFQFYFWKNRLR